METSFHDAAQHMPALALIGTALLVVLLTQNAKAVWRALVACYSRLHLQITTKFPPRKRTRSRSLSGSPSVQVSHLYIHPGTLVYVNKTVYTQSSHDSRMVMILSRGCVCAAPPCSCCLTILLAKLYTATYTLYLKSNH
jgi:hypothetical protein